MNRFSGLGSDATGSRGFRYEVGIVVIAVSLGHLSVLHCAVAEEARPNPDYAVNRAPDDRVAAINAQIERGWKDHKLQPSAEATDSEWCRRVYLDVLGRIPTVPELRKYLRDSGDAKRARLVQRLLDDPVYQPEYADHWATVWSNVLIGRTGGMDNGSLTSRDGMMAYLRQSFVDNKPYDQMVRELIEAEGTTAPGSSQFNGATNFLVDKLEDNAVLATARTAQMFLGTQVQCTQCHDHPFNEWKQNQFWELNAFFRQAVALRKYTSGTDDVREVELTDQDFAGEGSTPLEAEIYFQPRNGLAQVAYPAFIDGTALENRSGFVADVCRRKALGKLIVDSSLLDQALVNRMWRHFFSYGLNNPVDDLGPHRTPSHPELLAEMAAAFRKDGRNIKSLLTWITLSRPYALSSRTNAKNRADDPGLGELPRFSHFYLRQMTAEQLYASLLVATDADKTNGDGKTRATTRATWLRQFSIAFGTDEQDESSTFNGTIPQALMMFNGELVREATRLDRPTWLASVIASKDPPDEKIEQLYWAALSRMPRAKERQLANEILAAAAQSETWAASAKHGGGDSPADYSANPAAVALQDLWWALLNSNEFILVR